MENKNNNPDKMKRIRGLPPMKWRLKMTPKPNPKIPVAVTLMIIPIRL
ncbi:hypothetical protein CCACVL1_17930 [Corchorus capsularis]|uniref:Uncharacterized protein n=1 Tax=Corchorus capsularis TaxID=210143 RepID=A0A1R3HP41_COCAP|nr:hypothetical protein CCACVL1_17930 [Corchorus capsularis]